MTGLVARGRDVAHLESGFRLCVLGLNGEARDKVEEFTLWVCQQLNTDKPSPNTLKNVDLPASVDPGRWAQLMDDRCGPTTFPDECERVVIVSGSRGLWRRDSQGSVFALGYVCRVPSSVPAPALPELPGIHLSRGQTLL